MEFYCEKDSRIQFHHRPKNKRKGANACRNYGFELSKGKYIQWFDSDDIMLAQFLAIKVKALKENDVDYVISKAANFRDPDPENIISYNEQYYRFEEFEISNFNYVTQRINWLTYDFMGKREICEKVRFNENLNSAQERNFFSKLTFYSVNMVLTDRFLTLRRIHPNSTQTRLAINERLKKKEQIEFFYETWKELKEKKPDTASVNYLFNAMVRKSLSISIKWNYIVSITLGFRNSHKWKPGLWLFCYLVSQKILGKGHYFRRKFLSSYDLKPK